MIDITPYDFQQCYRSVHAPVFCRILIEGKAMHILCGAHFRLPWFGEFLYYCWFFAKYAILDAPVTDDLRHIAWGSSGKDILEAMHGCGAGNGMGVKSAG